MGIMKLPLCAIRHIITLKRKMSFSFFLHQILPTSWDLTNVSEILEEYESEREVKGCTLITQQNRIKKTFHRWVVYSTA